MVDLCRVCATDQVGANTVNLFQQTNKSRKILKRLKKIAGIELIKKEGMPECVCDGCQERLKQAFDFRLSCRRAQTLLCLSSDHSNECNMEMEDGLKAAHSNDKLSKKLISNDSIEPLEECSQLPVHFEKIEYSLPPKWIAENHFQRNNPHTDSDSDSKILLERLINSNDEQPISNSEVNSSSFIEESKDELKLETDFSMRNNHELKDSFNKFTTKSFQRKFNERKKVNLNENCQNNDDIDPVVEKIKPKKRGRKKKCENNSLPNDEKPPKFICELCGQSYSAQHYLIAHMNLHNGVNPYICEICSERFHSERNLKRHLMKHAGLKPYPCRHCDRRFLDFYARMRHERVHTNDRPAKCTYCDKAFTTNYILKNHLLTHTGERAFSCNICDRSFSQKKHLATHYKSIFHKQNEERAYELATTSVTK